MAVRNANFEKEILTQVEDAIRGLTGGSVTSATINGHSYTSRNIEDLMSVRESLLSKINKIEGRSSTVRLKFVKPR